MTAKLLHISAHARRAPVDRYAAIREAKTAQLYEEVHGDHMTKMLSKALELAFAEDDGLARRCMEGG